MQGQFEHCNFCFKGEVNINFVDGKFHFQDAFRKSQISKFIDPQIQFVKKKSIWTPWTVPTALNCSLFKDKFTEVGFWLLSASGSLHTCYHSCLFLNIKLVEMYAFQHISHQQTVKLHKNMFIHQSCSNDTGTYRRFYRKCKMPTWTQWVHTLSSPRIHTLPYTYKPYGTHTHVHYSAHSLHRDEGVWRRKFT